MSTDLPEQSEAEDTTFSDEDGVLYEEDVTPEIGILGFTLRELLIVGVWVVAFVVSFFPFAGGASIWGTGIQWVLPIGVPTVAVFLLVLRRFSPEGIRRVGSLGIDQFASVAFSVAAVFWVSALWNAVVAVIEFGVFGLFWSGIVQLVASLALVVLTVFAPIIPGLKEDFHGRLVTLAHRNSNPVRPVIARPRAETAPTAVEPTAPASETAPASDTGWAPETAPDEESLVRPSRDTGFPAATGFPMPAGVPTATGFPTVAGFPTDTHFDQELSDQQTTDEVARFDLAEQVPLAAHASGGDTGTEQATADEEYVPVYSRRSRGQEPEIVSDTGSIESLLQTEAREQSSDGAGEPSDAADDGQHDSGQHVTGQYVSGHYGDGQYDGRQDFATEQIEAPDLDATNPREVAPAAQQPFWILAPSERVVHDERGEPLFSVGPNAWALVIEDRGGAFVIRHDDGRIGYLHEISDITKG